MSMNDKQKADMLKAFCNYAESTGARFPHGRPDDETKPTDGTSAPISKGQAEQALASPSHPSREQKGSEQ